MSNDPNPKSTKTITELKTGIHNVVINKEVNALIPILDSLIELLPFHDQAVTYATMICCLRRLADANILDPETTPDDLFENLIQNMYEFWKDIKREKE